METMKFARLMLSIILGLFLFGPAKTVQAANVPCSAQNLIAAIETANDSPGDDIIDLSPGCLYNLTEINNIETGANGLPVIQDAATSGTLTINGNGATIARIPRRLFFPFVFISSLASTGPAPQGVTASASSSPIVYFRLVEIAPNATLTLNNVTLTGGNLPGQAGGAVLNGGTLEISGGAVMNNSADYGGGIYNTGTLDIAGGTISNNTGYVAGGGISSSGDLSVADSTFSGNSAELGDGLLVAGGSYSVTETTFAGNTSYTCPNSPINVSSGNAPGLISAIQCANSRPADDVIHLTKTVYTLTGINNTQNNEPTGLPTIAPVGIGGRLAIHGNGATIQRSSAQGTPDFRILMVAAHADLDLDDLTIQNGKYLDGDGAGMMIGDGAMVTLDTVTVANNTASFGGGLAVGLTGTLTIRQSLITGNESLHDGAGINSGDAALTVADSLFENNYAHGLGGGIITPGGTAMITGTTFRNNSANQMAGGGGILVGDTEMIISGCTFNNNYAWATGGGLFVAISQKTTLVENSTFAFNTAGYSGGAIWNNGNLTVTHSTITGNSVTNYTGGGIINNENGSLSIGSTIVAGNNDKNGSSDIRTMASNPTINSLGYNLIGDSYGFSISGDTTGNLMDEAAQPLNLGDLQDNGGPTQTMALLAGSVAMNAGDPFFAPPPATDQRGAGFRRVANGRIDIGAYESQ